MNNIPFYQNYILDVANILISKNSSAVNLNH